LAAEKVVEFFGGVEAYFKFHAVQQHDHFDALE